MCPSRKSRTSFREPQLFGCSPVRLSRLPVARTAVVAPGAENDSNEEGMRAERLVVVARWRPLRFRWGSRAARSIGVTRRLFGTTTGRLGCWEKGSWQDARRQVDR